MKDSQLQNIENHGGTHRQNLDFIWYWQTGLVYYSDKRY
ncbi:hypothetical protein RO31_1241 [Francisella tularensis subsp. tularensis str. SCHU S4 substr. NR-28534]|nr:hypothetical protein RO31_1241 [Francisella tularensis subsp. tularensis str. SCHU S4 substr. NR-28534]